MQSLSVDINDFDLPALIIAKDAKETVLARNDAFDSLSNTKNNNLSFAKLFPGLNFKEAARKDTLEYNGHFLRPSLKETTYEDKAAYLLIFTDISDLIKSSDALKEAIAEADAMAEMKSNFLATMSHEIRTPMQSVFGLLELVAEEKPAQRLLDMINIARESASGLLEILDDILDFAKMDANKMELDDFEIPIRLLARGTIEALAVKKGGPDVALLDDIDQEVPFVIKGDPKRLRQIIMNLMGNALKFTKDGYVKLVINTNAQHAFPPKGGHVLRFEIQDTGIGMSEEACNRLFKPFSQADNSTTRKYGGTGLGLSICKKLVTLMGGDIGVFSTEGEGSTFWFEIPAYAVATDQTSVELPKLDGVAVLSVEDHPMGAKEIQNSLKSMGAEVVHCATYQAGLDMAKRRPFDVAIIDQGLPDGLGLELMKEISEARPFTALIMYTVRDDYGLQHSCRAMGAQYLTKPASRAGLGEAVKSASSQIKQKVLDGPRKLVIAEDTATVRDVLQRQLDMLGAEATFTNNGQEALDAFATGEYGIVITDLHMPEVDGYGVVKEIRKQDETSGKETPVIVLTADVQMAQRQAYLSHGFDECLLKPVSLGQLRRLLIRWGLLSEEEVLDADKAANDKSHEDLRNAQTSIDLEAMKAQMGGVTEDTLSMVGMFVDMTAANIDKIEACQKENDLHGLAEAAHSLKGGARSACCMALGDIAAQIQDDAEAGKDCTELVKEARIAFDRIPEDLKTIKL